MRWIVALLALSACSQERHRLVDDPRDAAVVDARVPLDAGPDRPVETPTVDAAAQRCGKRACACDNDSDDDGDGLSDGLDPECTAAFDDDESSFATGLPNKLGGCRDCFWDDNAGQGDDNCRYPAECLTGSAPTGNGSCSSCQVGVQCVEACAARTPNGCDCFGCCAVQRSSGEQVFIELVESCQLARLDDVDSCPRCVQNSQCVNPCGRCELCLGKSEASLPADCFGSATCEDGLRSCRISAECRSGEYCLFGCCMVDVL